MRGLFDVSSAGDVIDGIVTKFEIIIDLCAYPNVLLNAEMD